MATSPAPGSFLLALALVAAGCTDYGLTVAFSLPAGGAPVTRVVIDVYDPSDPSDAGVSPDYCDALAFGELTVEALSISQVAQALTEVGVDAALSGIPRLGDKLLHARGLDATDRTVVAGCAMLGTIDGEVSLTIAGEPTVLIATPPGQAALDDLPVAITDLDGVPLAGVAVRPTLHGPGAHGVRLADVTTDADGIARVQAVLPTLPGPVALDLVARWQLGPAARALAFLPPLERYCAALPGSGAVADADALEARYQLGRIGPGGQLGIAALGPAVSDPGPTLATAQALVVYYNAEAGTFIEAVTPVDAATAQIEALGLIAVDGESRDRVVSVVPGSRLVLEVAPGPPAIATWAALPTNGNARVRHFVAVDGPGRPCAGRYAGGDRVLIERDDGIKRILDQDLVPVSDQDDALDTIASSRRVRASGCVSHADDPAVLQRTLILTARVNAQGNESIETFLATLTAAVGRPEPALAIAQIRWRDALATGFGFAPAVGVDAAALIGVDLGITGAAITRSSVSVAGDGTLAVEELSRLTTPSISLSTDAGDLDGDGVLDFAGVISVQTPDGFDVRAMAALGAAPPEPTIVAVLRGISDTTAQVWMIDLDLDGHDEIVVGTATSLRIFDGATVGDGTSQCP